VKNGTKAPEPLLPAAFEIARRERIGEGLEPDRVAAGQKHVPRLPEAYPLGLHPLGEPVMLIDAQPRGEGKVRTDADEHPAPLAIEQVEVVLDGPAPFVFQMPAVVLADSDQDARGLAGFQNDDHVVRIGPPKVRVDEVVAPLLRRRVQHRHAPCRSAGRHPVLVLRRGIAEHRFTHGVALAVGVEEADDTFGLLERLNQRIQQDAIEAPVRETNAIVVMLVEGVHGNLPGGPTRKDTSMGTATSVKVDCMRACSKPYTGAARSAASQQAN
jgi:hypothetical protein